MVFTNKATKEYLLKYATGIASCNAVLDSTLKMEAEARSKIRNKLISEGTPSSHMELNEMVTNLMEELGFWQRNLFLTMIYNRLLNIGYSQDDAYMKREAFRVHYKVYGRARVSKRPEGRDYETKKAKILNEL